MVARQRQPCPLSNDHHRGSGVPTSAALERDAPRTMMRCFFSGVTEGCQEKRRASQQSKEGRIRKSPSGDLDNARQRDYWRDCGGSGNLDNAGKRETGEIVAAVETWTTPARETGEIVAAVETWTTPARETGEIVAAVETWTTPARRYPDIQGSNTRNRGASSERRSSANRLSSGVCEILDVAGGGE